jgi:hypothetical protein
MTMTMTSMIIVAIMYSIMHSVMPFVTTILEVTENHGKGFRENQKYSGRKQGSTSKTWDNVGVKLESLCVIFSKGLLDTNSNDDAKDTTQ